MRGVLFCLVLISFTSKAQLSGPYIRDGEVYNFHSDGSFDWIKTDADISYGNGHYKISGKKLELMFDKARLQLDVQLNEIEPNSGSKSIVEVRVMYSNGQAIPQTKFTLIQSQISQYLNQQGILKLELSNPASEDKFVIEVDRRGSNPIKITLKDFDTLLGIVVDETARYKENTTETVMFKQKRRKILLNRKAFNKN